ncbi:MAG: alpha/beta hydrolase [Gammaproteobacteria bacterium]|nr:alpha/beta hydrolase [Gammaproteobacteria bacterium]NIM71963.1 alpha/beta hydrolase [Gammaproteobacteria bacterium]NIN38150.1 alpha/beta hydrolase [Gammaproteobacteria bacterium]NIQ25374.1 alpha/beta hydrolase [Gammaproteobacteria bacterium]NIR18573.1 alpha/beta hydrolase [Gammaproteobacteria bacterium]
MRAERGDSGVLMVLRRHANAHRAALFAVLVALTLAAGCLQLRVGDSEAGLVLEDLVSKDSRLRARTPQPVFRPLRFGDGAELLADLHVPADGVRAGIVLVPGLAPAGRRDPRLVSLAQTLARVGFLVLIPDVPGFRSYRMGAEDVGVLVSALRTLVTLPEMQPRLPAGIGAFSFAVGPAVIAALHPAVAERLDFVVAVGGYHDLQRLIAYYTTGAHRGETDAPTPYDKGKWIFALGVSEKLPDPSDRRAIQAVARAALGATAGAADPALPTNLSAGGAALLELLGNTTPERVPHLLARLPAALRAEITALNPAEQPMATLRARLLLLHGRSDNVIPYSESVALAESVPAGRARLFIIEGLAHVDLQLASGDVDILLALVGALLEERAPGET